MLKRISAGLAALALACGLTLAVQSSASATQTQCVSSVDTSVTFCIQFDKDPGDDGFYVYWVRASCKPFIFGTEPLFGWEDVAVDGHQLQISKLDGGTDLKWSQGDSNSNVNLDSGGDHACTRTWWVQKHWPDMNHLYTVYTFTEQRNNQPDERDAVDMDFVNGNG